MARRQSMGPASKLPVGQRVPGRSIGEELSDLLILDTTTLQDHAYGWSAG